jgi:GTP pyrophosphokinase
LRSFLESISQDVRLVILHLGLRLAELEALASQRLGDGRTLAQESLDLYVPLADRMGMGRLRSALEDGCFRILEPSIYEELVQDLEPLHAEDETCLRLLTDGIQHLLERNGIKGTVHGRTKGLYSLYRKMCCQERPLNEIMDRIGLRIIVSTPEECYMVLGLLHTHFRPIPGTFDDYIGLPKENGYRALHTCVYPVPDVSYKPIEIQIRTEGMHREALFGIAAHWRYKIEEEATQAHQGQLRWLRSLLAQHAEAVDHTEFIELLRRQVFSNNLLVFGKGGQPIWLPEGALVSDFERLVGAVEDDHVARVNGRIRPRDYALRDGDTMELTKRRTMRPPGGTHD